MVCPVNFVKKIIPILILVSLTVSVIAIMSQHVTFALYFLPLNNTIINQEGENVKNQTTALATPIPTPTSNQTTALATPIPTPTSNQTTALATPTPTPTPPVHRSYHILIPHSTSKYLIHQILQNMVC